MSSALPAVQGAVQGAGDAVTLLVATGLPPLLRKLQQQLPPPLGGGGDSDDNDDDDDGKGQRRSSSSSKTAANSSSSTRRLAVLSAKDLTTFRAVARLSADAGASLLSLGGLAAVAAAARMSPSGPGCCDHCGRERWANVATSAPYIAVGLRAFQRRRTPEAKAWGLSMAGVGLASAFFHASKGEMRTWGRRLDYWSIGASSALLCRALRPGGGVPRRLTAASLLMTPFRPFPVSTANTLAMEFDFLRRAAVNGGPDGQSPGLRTQQLLHSAAALGAISFFALEEALPRAPFLHSTWHLLSSVSCATTNALLEDVERDLGLVAPGGKRGQQQQQQQQLVGSKSPGAGGGRQSIEMFVTPLV
jgi:hypothetical protein